MEGNFLRVVFIATNVDENDEKVKNGAGGVAVWRTASMRSPFHPVV